jgi:xanthine dehydrogenase YagR molybdenum-binding subunit
MTTTITTSRPVLGTPVARLESRDKVTGAARYAADRTPPGMLHAWPVPAEIIKGEITAIDRAEALALPGAVAVLAHDNAPRLGPYEDATLAVLQSSHVAHRGEIAAITLAETLEAARAMALALRIGYAEQSSDVLFTPDHPGLYRPETAVAYPAERTRGMPEAEFAAAPVRIDATYHVPAEHNHPMEPHASVAVWEGDDRLTVHDSSQGSTLVQQALAALFGLAPDRVTVLAEHVGGGFGAKGTPRPVVVAAALAARYAGRPVKLLLPRRQMPALVGHRPPTVQRVRIGAERDGSLTAVLHETFTQTSTVREYTEAASAATRVMYVHPHSRTDHLVVPLDVPSPSWMRAPGEAPGMFALESAMDELATELDMDPVELRLRNEAGSDPDTGLPFSSRHLENCLREGGELFGWYGRDRRPGTHREGRLLIGTGVAAATYPAWAWASSAQAHADPDGGFRIGVNATDIGTGARTVLAQVAADVLRAPLDLIRIEIGRSDLPPAPMAGGSLGTASWGWAVDKACRALRRRLDEHDGPLPPGGLTESVSTEQDVRSRSQDYARHSFGAQFAEVQVDVDTGETRVRRLLGLFAAGRILNPRTARSQLTGGMLMGMSMALHESAHIDPAFGDYAECDLVSYHIATEADIPDIEVRWIDEPDAHAGPLGAKGIGELGIVGTAAAIANAVHHATGLRLRTLPLTPDILLPLLPAPPRPADPLTG